MSLTRNVEEEKAVLTGKIETLIRLLPLTKKIYDLNEKVNSFDIIIKNLRQDLDEATKLVEKDSKNLKNLKDFFLENLLDVGFPGITENDKILLNTKDFIPHIMNSETNTILDFYNVGSGGKKTIFKACFALAFHRLSRRIESHLPTFLIIDTPMKNISERENEEIFKNFYDLIYKLKSNELKDVQIILVDKEYYEPESLDIEVLSRHMTPNEDESPPLIPYYRGL